MNNNHLVLISGKSGSGKSASLMGVDKPEGVMYLNCENGKKLPFKPKFKELIVIDPVQVYQAFEEAEKMPDVHTIVIDTLTYLMDMYESTKVLNSSNTMQAWGQYAQYMKVLMSQIVAKSSGYAITPEDKALGFKYVYQTRLTKETVNERIRAPMGMWDIKATYIDNNLQKVINRLHEYYK